LIKQNVSESYHCLFWRFVPETSWKNGQQPL